jgi:hypothetical protein
MSGLLDQDSAANLLGISPKEMARLGRDGVIPRQDGKYHPVALVRGYIEHIKAESENRKFLTQTESADRLDMSERNFREVCKKLSLDHRTMPFDVVAIEYIRHLREQAAGRSVAGQEAQTRARTRESEASAKLKELQYLREVGALVMAEDVLPMFVNWATTARSEVQFSVEKIIAGVESQHGIKIDQGLIDDNLRHAFGAIASYPDSLQEDDEEGVRVLDAAS